MAKYRKKPVVIEAIQYDGTFPLAFLAGEERVRSAGDGSGACEIVTPAGTVIRCEQTDWIVRDANGGLYPLTAEHFSAIYEPVEP